MELSYKDLLAQDQKKLRGRMLKRLKKEGKSVMAMAKAIEIPTTTLRRWLVEQKDIVTYSALAKIVSYLENKENEPDTKDFKDQTKIK